MIDRNAMVRFGAPVRGALAAVLLLAAVVFPARAGMDQMIRSLQQSDFQFGRTESRLPYPPLSWLAYTIYAENEFTPGDTNTLNELGWGKFRQQVVNQALVLPAYIGKKDMILVGESAMLTYFHFADPGLKDEELYMFAPVGAWVRQFTPKLQGGAFLVPMAFSSIGGSAPYGWEIYCGAMGSYRSRDDFTWLFGGVYEHSFGDSYFYPDIGFIWLPSPRWSISLLAPWPTVSYSAADDIVLSLGFVPAGAQWRLHGDADQPQAVLNFGSWNLMAGGEARIWGPLWLYAGLGYSGFRSLTIGSSGTPDIDVHLQDRPLVHIALNLRVSGGAAKSDKIGE
jgi:hypothetical protein